MTELFHFRYTQLANDDIFRLVLTLMTKNTCELWCHGVNRVYSYALVQVAGTGPSVTESTT